MRPYKEITEQQKTKLSELIEYAGSVKRLADSLGVPYTTAHSWVVRGRISAVMAIQAEKITSGAITKQMLRPDVKEWIG